MGYDSDDMMRNEKRMKKILENTPRKDKPKKEDESKDPKKDK